MPYIERFGVFTNTPKLELCLCSFEDKLSFAFTSRYDTVNIEPVSYTHLDVYKRQEKYGMMQVSGCWVMNMIL